MKNFVLISFLISLSLSTFSQNYPSGRRGSTAKIGQITGTVIDATSKEPIAYATVSILEKESKKIITGGLTQENGKFSIEQIPSGIFMVEISFIGYSEKQLGPYHISTSTSNIYKLKTIEIGLNENEIDAVVVETEGNAVKYEVDKKIYDASKLKAAEGGTARDVLEQIPSITISSDQTLQLRGSSNVQILINGRPSSLDFETIINQIPEKQIKSIEIITNPSAKYDAEGSAGIINILLKENNLEGLTGNVSASWGTENKWNGNFDVAYKKNKWNFSTGYGYNRFKDDFYRDYTNLRTSISPNPQLSNSKRDFQRNNHSFKLGADYYLDANNTFFISGRLRKGKDNDSNVANSENVYTSLFNGQEFLPLDLYTYKRFTESQENGDGYQASASYQHTFNGNLKHNLLVDFNQSFYDETEENNYQIPQFVNNRDIRTNGFNDLDTATMTRKNTTISVDYTNPFQKESKNQLEVGYRTTISERDRSLNVFYNNTAYTPSSGTFNFEQIVHAGYSTYQHEFSKKINIKGGLRYEYADVDSNADGAVSSRYNKQYGNLFPSASASYKVNDDLQFRTAYSKRIRRPRGRQLNPLAGRTDPNNTFRGNPNLEPEFTNSYEIGANKYWNGVDVETAVYHRAITNQFQITRTNLGNGRYQALFVNIGKQNAYGAESSLNIRPNSLKWFSSRLSANYNYSKVTQNNTDLNTTEADQFSGSLFVNLRLPKKLQSQISMRYQGPTNNFTGQSKAMWGLNTNISKRILKNKGSIYLRANDMFNTFKLDINFRNNEGDRQHIVIDWPSQMAFIGFNYSFGQLKEQKRQKLQRKQERRNEGGGIEL